MNGSWRGKKTKEEKEEKEVREEKDYQADCFMPLRN